MKLRVVISLFLSIYLSACSLITTPDYRRFREYQPKSILVLPPINTSNTLRAPEIYLASIAEPLGEAGYYVFPPIATLKYFRDQGIPTGIEARDIPTTKLREIFGADAALYASIEEWGENYQIITAENRVRIRLSLVDLKNNIEIWTGVAEAVDQPHNNDGIADAIIGAIIHGLSNNDPWVELSLAKRANSEALHDQGNGLLIGPKRPNFAEDTRGNQQINN